MSVHRPAYRDPKTPKSVCVYTIAQESRYLIIENVSTMGNVKDFVQHCQQFGSVINYECLDTHTNSSDNFDVILLKYDTVSSARYAKRKLDNKPYDYQLLRANYAPEYENAEDIRTKFQDRLISVTKRLQPRRYNKNYSNKRKKELISEPILDVNPVEIEDNIKEKSAIKKRRRI